MCGSVIVAFPGHILIFDRKQTDPFPLDPFLEFVTGCIMEPVWTIDWFPSLIKLHFRYADKLLKGENQSTFTTDRSIVQQNAS